MKKYKWLISVAVWYKKRSMKQLQYLIAIFIFLLSFFGPLYKLKVDGPGGRGYYWPSEPLTWIEIFDKIPDYAFFALGFSVFFFFLSGLLFKDAIRIEKKGKKRKDDKLFSEPNTHECRVCGQFSEKHPWGEDGKSPTLELCPCCGVQFGVDDDTIDIIKAYRAKWINEGTKWLTKEQKPDQWNIEEQLRNIPEKFK